MALSSSEDGMIAVWVVLTHTRMWQTDGQTGRRTDRRTDRIYHS